VDTKITFTQENLELIKKTCVPAKANDEHIDLFIYVCQKYGLDPLTKEIVLDIRENTKTGEKKAVIITTRDGYLKAAMQDPAYNGVNGGVIRENDTFEVDPIAGILKHSFGVKRGKIVAAWAVAKAKNRDPIICTADFSEYYEANSKSYVWQDYPSAMIQKVAEIMAMKRQFNITGLVGEEEIGTGLLDLEVDESSIKTNDMTNTTLKKPAEEKPEEKPAEKAKSADTTTSASTEKPKEESQETIAYEVVLMGNPRKKNGQDIIGVQAVVGAPSEYEGEYELLAPLAYKDILTNGAALIAEGSIKDGKLEAVSVKPIAGGEGEPVKNETTDAENIITLLATPKSGTITYKGKNLTKPFAACEYPGNYQAIFAVGETLKDFFEGDALEVKIVDRIEKDGKLMLFISEAKKISSQQQAG
jgi:phage recombination protein Bet